MNDSKRQPRAERLPNEKQYAKISSFLNDQEPTLQAVWVQNDWLHADSILGVLQKLSWYQEKFLEHVGLYIVLDKNCFLLGGKGLEVKKDCERQFVLAWKNMLEDTIGESPLFQGIAFDDKSCSRLCEKIVKDFQKTHSSNYVEDYAYHEFLEAVKMNAYEDIYINTETYEAVTAI